MRSRALYYPYIQVPNNPWFTRTLLYWDEVGAIVPSEYLENPARLGVYMVGLVREQLVTQVIPGMHIWKVPRFAAAFLDHLDRRGQPSPGAQQDWVKVHMEKLQDLAEALCTRGLASKDTSSQYSPWYMIQPQIADEFMAYLAAVLGQIDDQDALVPVTDRQAHLNAFRDQAPSAGRRAPVRELVLRGLLPSPLDAVDPPRLAEFKARHGNELRDFRREIEGRVSEWSLVENDADRALVVEEGVRSLQDRVREVSEMMGRARWPRIDFGGLCTVVGSGVAGWSAVATGDVRVGLLGAGLSLAPVVYNAFRGADHQPSPGPLAYAVLAAAELD